MCESGGVTGADAFTTARPEDEETADAKDALRADAAQRRAQRSAHALAEAAGGVALRVAHVIDSLALVPGDTVAAYASRRDEPGTAGALEVARERGVDVLLPVLGERLDRCWGRYVGPESLAQRAPGRPPEPPAADGGPQVLEQARLILVPALLVDGEGYRLGRGGGWYDRALLHARRDAIVLAVVYDDEVRREPLPREDHDVPVAGILTPSRWWLLGAHAG